MGTPDLGHPHALAPIPWPFYNSFPLRVSKQTEMTMMIPMRKLALLPLAALLVLAPALVRTPMSARAQADPQICSFVERKQPLSHGFLEAGDIAETALFLLSEKSRHMTGQVITVDGGWTL